MAGRGALILLAVLVLWGLVFLVFRRRQIAPGRVWLSLGFGILATILFRHPIAFPVAFLVSLITGSRPRIPTPSGRKPPPIEVEAEVTPARNDSSTPPV